MKKHWFCRLTALCLSALLFCAACGNQGASAPGEGETVKSGDDTPVQATTIRMIKTEGTVGVADDAGAQVPVISDMGLYSGYGVDTEEKSYAWINLDDVKLTKMDAESKISIRKEDKSLDVLVEQGSLFFHVTEPLAEDESFTIRSSNTVVGIRGTCGWVTLDPFGHLELYLIEGQVEYTYQNPDTGADDTSTVQAGQKLMLLEDCDGTSYIEVIDFWPEEVPLFVGIEGMENETLREWMEAYGMTPDDFLAMAGASPDSQESSESQEPEASDPMILTMPITSDELFNVVWDQKNTDIIVQSDGEETTLELNVIDISEGQTLTFEEGINIRVVYPQDYDSNFEKGATLMIRGTMIVNGDLTNEGMISISGGRLEVNGDVQNPSGSEISLERHPNYPENVPTLIVTGVLHNQGAFYNYGNGTIEATVE